MPSTQNLRRRIKSVKNTRQITKAMELVAAAKMRRTQDMAIKSRHYSNVAQDALNKLSSQNESSAHPILTTRSQFKKGLLFVITSDKGLAGAYNSYILKKSAQFLADQKIAFDVVPIGRKAQDFFKNTNVSIAATLDNLPPYPLVSDVSPLVSIAIADYVAKKYDTAYIGYTRFHSMVKQEAIIKQFLPIQFNADSSTIARSNSDLTFEPNPKIVLATIIPRLLEVQFYQAILESIASEHSARMLAMKNASDNAKDIIDDLQLTYNSVRQASITQELAEISAGVSALS